MSRIRHCGGGSTRVFTQGTANHLQVCPVLGRNSAPHDAVRDALSHLVVQNGVTDAAVVETRLTAADGGTFDADVVFFDPSSRARVILEVSIVTIGSDTSLGRGARAGLDGVNAQLRAREDEKRNHSVVQRLLNEAGNITVFTPIVMSACGAMGPSMVVLKEVYGRAKEADKFLMSQQPALKHSWNTMVASSFWDMRLRIACAATDAEYQNRIILHDNTHPQPLRRGTAAPSGPQLRAACGGAPRCRCLEDQPRRVVVSIPGARSSMRPLVLLAERHLNSRSS